MYLPYLSIESRNLSNYCWVISKPFTIELSSIPIQHSSLRVQEGRDVFHDDCGDAVIDDISEVFELVMSILDYGQSLPALKVGVGCVPLLVCLAFAFLDVLYDELLLFVFDFRHID